MQARELALHSRRGIWMLPLIKVDLLQGQREGNGMSCAGRLSSALSFA